MICRRAVASHFLKLRRPVRSAPKPIWQYAYTRTDRCAPTRAQTCGETHASKLQASANTRLRGIDQLCFAVCVTDCSCEFCCGELCMRSLTFGTECNAPKLLQNCFEIVSEIARELIQKNVLQVNQNCSKTIRKLFSKPQKTVYFGCRFGDQMRSPFCHQLRFSIWKPHVVLVLVTKCG